MAHALLVNPWIYDFAAYDLCIKPVGLLRIAGFLRKKGDSVSFIDCLDGYKGRIDAYGFFKIKKKKIEKPTILKKISRPYFRYGMPQEDFIERIKTIHHVDVIYIASGMTYWYPGVQHAIQFLRTHFGTTPIILGGIYATLCTAHAQMHSGADTIIHGDYFPKETLLDHSLYPAYDLLKDRSMLPLQLTRGCPFQCTYCAGRLFTQEFSLKAPEMLFQELLFYYQTYHTTRFAFYDDALLYRAEQGIKPFLRKVIEAELPITLYTPNGLHARYIDQELALLLKKAHVTQLRLSLETASEEIQHTTGAKVTNQQLEESIYYLKEAGFTSQEIGVYLLTGSPWTSINTTQDDIQYIHSLKVKAIISSFSPIPGTKDYAHLVKEHLIEQDMDPLWHNHTIFGEYLAQGYTEIIRKLRHMTASLNKNFLGN